MNIRAILVPKRPPIKKDSFYIMFAVVSLESIEGNLWWCINIPFHYSYHVKNLDKVKNRYLRGYDLPRIYINSERLSSINLRVIKFQKGDLIKYARKNEC